MSEWEASGRRRAERPGQLGAKARWYLESGVTIVWIVLPDPREVVVLLSDRETRHGRDSRLPAHPSLPDLAPSVSALFAQLDATG